MKSMNNTSLVAESADTPVPSADSPSTSTESTLEPVAQSTTTQVTPVQPADSHIVEQVADGEAAQAPQEHAAPAADAQATQPAAAPAVAPGQSARSLLKQLQQQFPAFRDCLPLAIGIDKQLLGRIPGLDRKTMRAALGIHTGSLRYLRAMEKATVRYDLDGVAGAEVTDTHRTHAKETLQLRFKKEADRKKAERDAAREAAAAEEANKLRQEKLLQLASKFSRG